MRSPNTKRSELSALWLVRPCPYAAVCTSTRPLLLPALVAVISGGDARLRISISHTMPRPGRHGAGLSIRVRRCARRRFRLHRGGTNADCSLYQRADGRPSCALLGERKVLVPLVNPYSCWVQKTLILLLLLLVDIRQRGPQAQLRHWEIVQRYKHAHAKARLHIHH